MASLPKPCSRRRWQIEQSEGTQAESGFAGRQGPDEQGQQAAALGQGQGEEGLVPLSVVMHTCLAQGIVEQYRCVSKACLG